MRRIMLLALLALAMPTATLADTISFNTGNTFNVTNNLPEPGESFLATFVGLQYTITIFSPDVTLPDMSLDDFAFNGGTVTVKNTRTGATLFQNSISEGTIDTSGLNIIGGGSLETNTMITDGSFDFLIGEFQGVPSNASVTATTVPEPSALEGLLLGTGLLGLAEMARRKLRLGI